MKEYILTADNDGAICLWDTKDSPELGNDGLWASDDGPAEDVIGFTLAGLFQELVEPSEMVRIVINIRKVG